MVLIVKLTPDQPIPAGNQSTFTCNTSGHEIFTSYIWKLNDTTVPGENKRQYNITPTRAQNGMKLSCIAITAVGVASEESQVILQVFGK